MGEKAGGSASPHRCEALSQVGATEGNRAGGYRVQVGRRGLERKGLECTQGGGVRNQSRRLTRGSGLAQGLAVPLWSEQPSGSWTSTPAGQEAEVRGEALETGRASFSMGFGAVLWS